MEKSKKERLKAAGWRIGGVREFLGISAAETDFVELKVALSGFLREVRVRRGWTQARVAKMIRSSQSRVAKMEAADASVSLDLLVRTLLAFGTSRKDMARIIGTRAA